jgi:hypothetical protein
MECGREISLLTDEGKRIIDYLRSLNGQRTEAQKKLDQWIVEVETLESWLSIPSPID